MIYQALPSYLWGSRQFCKDCSDKLRRQPEAKRRHRIADSNDRCTCGHEAFHHESSVTRKLENCRAESCSCERFSLVS